MDCPSGLKTMTVIERWPLVEVRLYLAFVTHGGPYLKQF